MIRATRSLLVAAIAALACVSAASAEDRAPTAEELTQIEEALRADGFTSWEDVEFDDGVWEVDDALPGDGLKYDVRLDQTFTIIDREEDGRDLSRRVP